MSKILGLVLACAVVSTLAGVESNLRPTNPVVPQQYTTNFVAKLTDMKTQQVTTLTGDIHTASSGEKMLYHVSKYQQGEQTVAIDAGTLFVSGSDKAVSYNYDNLQKTCSKSTTEPEQHDLFALYRYAGKGGISCPYKDQQDIFGVPSSHYVCTIAGRPDVHFDYWFAVSGGVPTYMAMGATTESPVAQEYSFSEFTGSVDEHSFNIPDVCAKASSSLFTSNGDTCDLTKYAWCTSGGGAPFRCCERCESGYVGCVNPVSRNAAASAEEAIRAAIVAAAAPLAHK